MYGFSRQWFFRAVATASMFIVLCCAQSIARAGTPPKKPLLVMITAEKEYETEKTLPAFAQEYLASAFRLKQVTDDPKDRNNLPGLELLDEANVAIFSTRRRAPTTEQMKAIHRFVDAGKPVVGIRTASHGFALRRNAKPPEGHATWPKFDQEVLGCHYTGHHNNKKPSDPKTHVRMVPEAAKNPILRGVPTDEFVVRSWLYKSLPLTDGATLLMTGRVGDRQPHEPVAWTYQRQDGGRTFCTSLGHANDFKLPAFNRLLRNGVYWAAGMEVPAK